MQTVIAFARVTALSLAIAIAGFAVTGCASLGLGGSSEPSVSPRAAVMAAVDKVQPVIDQVTLLVATGVVSDNVTDDIAQFGPTVQRIAATYLDGARACLVEGGGLTTEPLVGGDCAPSTLLSLYNAFDREVIGWMVAASERGDQQAAAVIGGARLVVSLVPKPIAGGMTAGYRDEPDVPLALFDARRATLKQSFELLLATSAARTAKKS